jgi:RNA polymerase sporulation-specific sigma factor
MKLDHQPISHLQFSDQEIKQHILSCQQGNKQSRDLLVHANVRLVWSIVQRFLNRGYEIEDLFQIGCIGLMKAIDKFDLSYDVKFSTYAVPMIIGEIQRFIRDDGSIKVSRSIKELANRMRRRNEEWCQEHGVPPSIQQLAVELNVSAEDLIQAQEAVRSPHSIHETVYENDGDPIEMVDQIANTDDEKWFEKFVLSEAVKQLTEREQLIVYLRYYRDQTQAQVAERLGISQVQVSRLEKRILLVLKEKMVH